MEGSSMLVLSRKLGEKICIADNIEVTIVAVRGDRVQLGINAPLEVPIHRQEVQERLQERTIHKFAVSRRWAARDLVAIP